jgi:WhiB family redox-sensing transcriptional regulator
MSTHLTDRPENRFVTPDPGGTVALTAPHAMTLNAIADDWQIDNAKSVCTDCEVRQPCLDFALATNQDSGIWGGTSEEERRKLRRQWLAARRKAS